MKKCGDNLSLIEKIKQKTRSTIIDSTTLKEELGYLWMKQL